MTELYGRRVDVLIGRTLVGSSVAAQEQAAGRNSWAHEITFAASQSLTPDPNTATVELVNLGPNERKAIETSDKKTQFVLYAGYRDQNPLPDIFKGRVTRVSTRREGTDIITTVEAGSAVPARSYSNRLDKAYRSGTSVTTVINDLLKSLPGVGKGNLSEVIGQLNFQGAAGRFEKPYAVSGPAWSTLVRILEDNGFTCTTEGDNLLVTGIDQALRRTAVRLTEDTGLIGAPSVDKEKIMTAETLLIPNLSPGRIVQIDSEFLQGEFKLLKTEHFGSLYGADFGVTLEGKAVRRR